MALGGAAAAGCQPGFTALAPRAPEPAITAGRTARVDFTPARDVVLRGAAPSDSLVFPKVMTLGGRVRSVRGDTVQISAATIELVGGGRPLVPRGYLFEAVHDRRPDAPARLSLGRREASAYRTVSGVFLALGTLLFLMYFDPMG